jgi:type IV pilus assembly protein PilB
LVVASSQYLDESQKRLRRVLRDARGMEAALADPAIGGFTVISLVNRTTQEIRSGVDDFLTECTADDLVVIYVCGQAMLDVSNRLLFAGTDTRTDRLASTSVEAGWLAERLDDCPARRQIVILDTDFSGAFARVGLGGSFADMDPRGCVRVILTSSGANQRTANDESLDGVSGPLLFTGVLARGLLTGEADADADGLITVDEAYAYVCAHLSSGQTPQRWMVGQGSLILARTPGDAPTSAPHPERDHETFSTAHTRSGPNIVPRQHTLPTPQTSRPNACRRRQIGEVLVERGMLTREQFDLAVAAQRETPGPRRAIDKVVVDLGLASERDVAECLAQMLGLDFMELSQVVPAPDVVRLLPRVVAERIRVLVIDRTPQGDLVVAAADPTNVLAFDDVRLFTRSTGLKIHVATDSQIREQLNRAWSLGSNSSQVADMVQEAAGADQEQEDWPDGASDSDAPIVKLVAQILADGVRLRASDIHIEVQRDTLRVRYRVDGLLRDVMQAPRRVATSVISRIKIISGLDIAERRTPQDGRTRFSVEGRAIDARVSTLPSLHGEKVVIRLLTRGDAVPTLSSLGLEPDQLLLLEAALTVPQGLVLITGPTGSGKTNTLYSAIAQISSPELNIVTLEDPVEVELPGITQVAVNVKSGVTFSGGLRSILRQDPDIILVGEVRDGETAQLALKAAMTGHLVLTTLHTNSAVAALTRLVDMGAEPFAVASSLTIAMAQRLVRRPCQTCVAAYQPDQATLALLGLVAEDLVSANPRKGTGCHDCAGTGYRGRTAVYEVLTVDGPMRQVLTKEATEAAISAQAEAAGMLTLRQAAILKARQGRTTFEEAVRVTPR